MLIKPSGDRWRKSDHSRPFLRACVAAGEDPREVTIYALRHSSIVRQILANVPIRVVAAGYDTSVAMIEKNYARFIQGHTDALVRVTLLYADQGASRLPDICAFDVVHLISLLALSRINHAFVEQSNSRINAGAGCLERLRVKKVLRRHPWFLAARSIPLILVPPVRWKRQCV